MSHGFSNHGRNHNQPPRPKAPLWQQVAVILAIFAVFGAFIVLSAEHHGRIGINSRGTVFYSTGW